MPVELHGRCMLFRQCFMTSCSSTALNGVARGCATKKGSWQGSKPSLTHTESPGGRSPAPRATAPRPVPGTAPRTRRGARPRPPGSPPSAAGPPRPPAAGRAPHSRSRAARPRTRARPAGAPGARLARPPPPAPRGIGLPDRAGVIWGVLRRSSHHAGRHWPEQPWLAGHRLPGPFHVCDGRYA